MSFNWEVSIGVVIQLAGSLGLVAVAVVTFRTKVDLILGQQERMLQILTDRLGRHEDRDEEQFEKIQTRLTDLGSGMQRLIGQTDILLRSDRRS